MPQRHPIGLIAAITRRRAIAGTLASVFPASSVLSVVEAQESDVPTFSSGPYQFREERPQRALPSIRLFGLDGSSLDLASLKGNPVILNFWASWCAACRTELPMLDRLQERSRATGLRVLAVSQDRGERAVVDRYVRSLKLRSLSLYWDPHGHVAFADRANRRRAPFALYGMPISYAATRSGRIVGYIPGAVDWTSEAAARFLGYLHRH